MAEIMAEIHYLKRDKNEAVVKVYSSEASGEIVDIALSTLIAPGETYTAGDANVTLKEIFWGVKPNKHIDVNRWDGVASHGHYYLVGASEHTFVGFVDNAYSEADIRLIGDGEFHCILKLNKTGGYS
jgi:hypothetical protein